MTSRFLGTTMLASAGILLAVHAASAEQVTLKFWDNQQTESGLQQFQQEAVEALRGREPRHQGRGHDDPLSGIPAAAADRRAGRQRARTSRRSTRSGIAAFAEAGAIAKLDDMAKAAGVTRRQLLPRRLGVGQLQGRALGHALQCRRLVFAFVNKALFKAAGVDPASIATWDGLEGRGDEADRRQQGPVTASA